MARPELIQYVEAQIKKGHTLDEVKAFLLKSKYDPAEVDECMAAANKDLHNPDATPPPQPAEPPVAPVPAKPEGAMQSAMSSTQNAMPNTPGQFKKRGIAFVIIISIITFGIYAVYWLISTTNELRKVTGIGPNPWMLLLLLVPLVNIFIIFWYYYKYSEAFEKLSGMNKWLMFLLWLVVGFVPIILAQLEYNKRS